MPVGLLLLAVGSYAVALLSSRGAANGPSFEANYVQVLGASGTDRHSVTPDPRGGTLFLDGRQGRAASASWRLVPRNLYNGHPQADGRSVIFVTAPDEGEARAENSASLAIDGKTLVTFRLPTPAASGRVSSDLQTAAPVAIDVPPGIALAFEFPIRLDTCPAIGCTLRIVAKDARWRIRRIGILYAVPSVAGPALWQGPGSVWLAILAACALAALSHLILSLGKRPSNTALARSR